MFLALGFGDPGCGAAWLARLTGGQEVGSSNLPSPTGFFGYVCNICATFFGRYSAESANSDYRLNAK